MARIGLTLDENSFRKLAALASIEGKKISTLAAEIVKSYVANRADDVEEIDEILQAKADYDENVERLRARLREKNNPAPNEEFSNK